MLIFEHDASIESSLSDFMCLSRCDSGFNRRGGRAGTCTSGVWKLDQKIEQHPVDRASIICYILCQEESMAFVDEQGSPRWDCLRPFVSTSTTF